MTQCMFTIVSFVLRHLFLFTRLDAIIFNYNHVIMRNYNCNFSIIQYLRTRRALSSHLRSKRDH